MGIDLLERLVLFMALIRCGLVCYPESLMYDIDTIIFNLESVGMLNGYAYILHDNDLDANGEKKKSHYHVYLRFNKGANPNTIANFFGISANLIIRITNVDGYLSYFVHAFDPDKYQYKIEDVVEKNVCVLDSIDRCNITDCKKSDDIISTMINYIIVDGWSLRKVLFWALEYGYISEFKKYYVILKDLSCKTI